MQQPQQTNHIQQDTNTLQTQQHQQQLQPQQVIMHYQTQPQQPQNQMIIDPNDPQQHQQQITTEMSNVQPQQQQQVIVQHNQQQSQQQVQQVIHQQTPQQHIVLPHGQNVVLRQHAQQPNQYVYDKRTIIQSHSQSPITRPNIVQQPPPRAIPNNNIRQRGQRILIQQPQSNVANVRQNANRFNRPVRAPLPNSNNPPSLVMQQNSQAQHLVRNIPQAAVRPLQRHASAPVVGVRPPLQSTPMRQHRPPAPRTISLAKFTTPSLQRTGNAAPRMIPPALTNLHKSHEQPAQSTTIVTNNGQQQSVTGTNAARRVSVSRGNTSSSSGEEYLALDDLEDSIQAAKIEKHPTQVVSVPQSTQPQQTTRPLQSVVGTQQVITTPQMHHVS